MGIVKGLVLIFVIIGGGLFAYSFVDPEGFEELFPKPPPKVNFHEIPKLTESDVKKDRTTILSVTVRNNENKETVSNVVAKLSVIEGSHPEEHLEFKEITPLSDTITPGDVSDTKKIPIRAIKISGQETKFRMVVEILVDGIQTDKHEFDVKIIPN